MKRQCHHELQFPPCRSSCKSGIGVVGGVCEGGVGGGCIEMWGGGGRVVNCSDSA